ncbi:MAG: hypothetical protein J0I47_05465 [Sphingomonas sp.]|uniref:hypothetical protein n=1 Tax=Sphingomonas sp. TaxID=28214 RepID=UPI001AC7487B|nr:hypothetical protein [Sphingomonas sp.]MBN8807671.1 hypothetical protein [Sphingomonas sp.]
MKIAACLSAAFVAGAMMVPGAATAAPQTTTTRTVTTSDHGQVTSRTTVRDHHNGWHGRTRWKTQCRTWWKHGHKYRTCKKVRVRW